MVGKSNKVSIVTVDLQSVTTLICVICVAFYNVSGSKRKKCLPGLDEYHFQIPKHVCEPSCRHSVHESVQADKNPDLYNVTHVFVEQIRENMQAVSKNLEHDKKKFLQELKADVTFQPRDILDLRSIEDSQISVHLRRSNKPEEIIHKLYAKVMILSGYLDLVQCMVDNLTTVSMKMREAIKTSVGILESKIMPLSCQLYAFTEQLGISKIKKKVCRYAEPLSGLPTNRDKTDFIITVLMEGVKYANQSVLELDSLPTEIKKCRYKNGSGNRRKLTCGSESEGKRRSRRTRSDRKIKRNKKKGKGRKNRKNKKGKRGKTDVSSRGNRKQSERRKNRRHRNKSRKPA